ncbi:MAG: aspartate-semialdehyde dehydrogenase [Ruminococcaceae bacterium]|nr:aspartate-semialdehyde dehydrogenase [Oscillospiraceae bacterium]
MFANKKHAGSITLFKRHLGNKLFGKIKIKIRFFHFITNLKKGLTYRLSGVKIHYTFFPCFLQQEFCILGGIFVDKKYKIGIIGATGMVGQRFISLLHDHPWFEIKVLAASARSAGKTYEEALGGRWVMTTSLPENVKNLTVLDAQADMEKIASLVDFVFCAVDMKKDEIRALENAYAKLECPVISNNSAHRFTPDVPMIIPELNYDHAKVIEDQKKRLGTKRGFVAVKSNCSLQSYVPALYPLDEKFGVEDVLVCTYQAISGAGKTFDRWPEMIDNVIPYIGGEEEKSEQEPLKIWGKVENGEIVPATSPKFTAQCLRVPVSDGHMAAVFVRFKNKPSKEEIIAVWDNFSSVPQELQLPHAPKKFLNYFTEDNMPQTKLHRDLEGGMAVSVGRLREDSQYDYKFVCLSHNTLRGAAGGGVLLAELLCAQGYIEPVK